MVDINTAADLLLEHDNILILAHQKPDGDTLGSAFGLMWALNALGKRARVECADGFPQKYDVICAGYVPESFAPEYTVAVDIASRELIGPGDEPFRGDVDLCIDHHKSNTLYAKNTWLDTDAAAVCQMIYELIPALGGAVDHRTANALYLGLCTDTGCFRHANTTAKSLRVGSELLELGADNVYINKLMFDTRSRGVLMVERMISESITYYFSDRCAVAILPSDVTARYGVSEEDLDGISSYTGRIEGVLAGVTIRTRPDDTYRISLRTVAPVDAARICSRFGGGGHTNAAGCTMSGELYGVINNILAAVEAEFSRNGLL